MSDVVERLLVIADDMAMVAGTFNESGPLNQAMADAKSLREAAAELTRLRAGRAATVEECKQIAEAVRDDARRTHDDSWREASARIVGRIGALSAHPPAGGWRDIATAPKDGTRVIIGWEKPAHVEVGCWRTDGEMWCGELSGFWKDKDWPTKWQPLPAPPAEKEE